MKYRCICGEVYHTKQRLVEHIGLLNPHWPRKSQDDKHADADYEQMASAIASYCD